MLVNPPLEHLLPKAENRYVLAMLAAKRARQLVSGAMYYVEPNTPNPVTLACEELGADKVMGVHGIVEPVVPLRPEIEAARRAKLEEEQRKREAEFLEENGVPLENPLSKLIEETEASVEFDLREAGSDLTEQLIRNIVEQDASQADAGEDA